MFVTVIGVDSLTEPDKSVPKSGGRVEITRVALATGGANEWICPSPAEHIDVATVDREGRLRRCRRSTSPHPSPPPVHERSRRPRRRAHWPPPGSFLRLRKRPRVAFRCPRPWPGAGWRSANTTPLAIAGAVGYALRAAGLQLATMSPRCRSPGHRRHRRRRRTRLRRLRRGRTDRTSPQGRDHLRTPVVASKERPPLRCRRPEPKPRRLSRRKRRGTLRLVGDGARYVCRPT